MQYEINVVEKDNGKAFAMENEGTLVNFSTIYAMDEFLGGSLKVFRNEGLFSETNRIDLVGTMGAFTIFDGLNQIFEQHTKPPYLTDLSVDYFEAGDKIVIEYERETDDKSHSLVSYLQMQQRVRAKKAAENIIGSP